MADWPRLVVDQSSLVSSPDEEEEEEKGRDEASTRQVVAELRQIFAREAAGPGTPPAKGRKAAGGLLYSSPMESRHELLSKYTCLGSLQLYSVTNQVYKVRNCKMEFIIKSDAIRACFKAYVFTQNGGECPVLDFYHDVKAIITTNTSSTIALQLENNVKIWHADDLVQIKILVWNTDNKLIDSRVEKIKQKLAIRADSLPLKFITASSTHSLHNKLRLCLSASTPIPTSTFYSDTHTPKYHNQQDQGGSDDDSVKELEIPKAFEPPLNFTFTDGTSYTIKDQDFKCLYNQDWINDTILDFFIKFTTDSAISNQNFSADEICVLSSFFYNKLISNLTDYYGNVKNWVTNSKLYLAKYIIIPVNINFHWFGCIIANMDKVYQYLVQKTSFVLEPPTIDILIYDSLQQTPPSSMKPVRDFIIAYFQDKCSLQLSKSLIRLRSCPVPQQPNMSDCGLHVILNTMKFCQDPVSVVNYWLTGTPSVDVDVFFESNNRKNARRHLRDILWDLHGKLDNVDVSGTRQNGSTPGPDDDVQIIENVHETEATRLADRYLPNDDETIHDEMEKTQSSMVLDEIPSSPSRSLSPTESLNAHIIIDDEEDANKVEEDSNTQATTFRRELDRELNDSSSDFENLGRRTFVKHIYSSKKARPALSLSLASKNMPAPQKEPTQNMHTISNKRSDIELISVGDSDNDVDIQII